MPDIFSLRSKLQELLSRPAYTLLLHRNNQFAKPGADRVTPESVADRIAAYLCESRPLLDPIEIVELSGPRELYRIHDGGERFVSRGRLTAQTLGASWNERGVFEVIWKATEKLRENPELRRKQFLEFVRSANFVLTDWNAMTRVVCMTVPSGSPVVVARGLGDWKAMKTPENTLRPGGGLPIRTVHDVIREGMMPLPGLVQCVVPLINGMWVQPVEPTSTKWPFAT